MPAQIPIHLSADEIKQLKQHRQSRKTPVRLLERSNIVLLAAEGLPNYQIATKLTIDVNKVGRWRNRFATWRLAGIEKDLPRGANHGGKKISRASQTAFEHYCHDDAGETEGRHPLVNPRPGQRPRDQSFLGESGLA